MHSPNDKNCPPAEGLSFFPSGSTGGLPFSPHQHPCPICGTPTSDVTANGRRHTYCSKICADRAYRRRQHGPMEMIDFSSPVGANELPIWERRTSQQRKGAKIDFGLAMLSILRIPGEPLALEDIAIWCDCSRERIRQIEEIALTKVKRRLSELESVLTLVNK